MKIIFIRHGIAEAYRENDKDRRLTLEGKIKNKVVENVQV